MEVPGVGLKVIYVLGVLLSIVFPFTYAQYKGDGDPHPINMSDPHLHQSTDVVVHVINRDHGYNNYSQRQSLESIENGTVQVVDGNLYRLRIIMADSICVNTLENENKTKTDCPLRSPGKRYRCEVAVGYQPWEAIPIDVLSYNCIEIQPNPPGGEMPINKNDPGVVESANAVVNLINRDRGYADIINRESLGQVLNGTFQILDGNIYHLLYNIGHSVCNNSIVNWQATSKECPLLHQDMRLRLCNATVKYKTSDFPVCSVLGYSCEPAAPGDEIPVNKSSQDVKLAAEAAISIINVDRGYSNKTQRRVLYEIEGGTEQVADGEIYRLVFTIADSVCKNIMKYFNATSKECPIPVGRFPVQRCESEINDRKWRPDRWFIMERDCVDLPPPPLPPPGGEMPINRSDPGVSLSVNAVINKINEDRGYADIITRLSLGELINGTVQITDGNIYRLLFGVGNSVCNNSYYNANATTEECPLVHKEEGLHNCNAKVAYKHWETPMCTVIEYYCNPGPPGDEHPINRSDPFVMLAAEAAVDVINWDRGYSDNIRRKTLYQVESGTVQVVDGEMYRLIFTISNSVCKNTEANANATAHECPIEGGWLGYPVQRCESQILYRNWLTQKTDVMEHSCVNLPPPTAPPGGERPINMSDPGVSESVNAVIYVINQERGFGDIIVRQSLGLILDGTVQVVDGELYRLLFSIGNSVCNNSIANSNATTEQCPIINGTLIRACNATIIYKHWETPRSTVLMHECQGPSPGDQRLINKTDPGVNVSAEAAVNLINKDRGYSYEQARLSLYEVEGGTVQIVDGEIFRLVFTVSNSVCKNTEENANATTKQCPVEEGDEGLPILRCEAQILYQHWNPQPTYVTEHSCEATPLPPFPPGGDRVYNKTDPHVIISANAAVDVINRDRGYSDRIARESLKEIRNGTYQVVDGELFHLAFTVADSNCTNSKDNAHATSEQCPVKPNDLRSSDCLALVLYKFWETPQTLVMNWECTKSRTKRDLLVSEQDINLSADFAVNEINKERGYSCCTYKYVVSHVTNPSSTLVSSGTALHMIVYMGESFCTNNELNKDRTAADCTLQPGSHLFSCKMTVVIHNGTGLTLDNHQCDGLDFTPQPIG